MENNFHLNLAGYRVNIRLKPTKPILFVSPMGQFPVGKIRLEEISHTYLIQQFPTFQTTFRAFSNAHVPFSLSPTTHCQRENKVGANREGHYHPAR